MKKSFAIVGILPLFLMACPSFAQIDIANQLPSGIAPQYNIVLNKAVIDQANILTLSEKTDLTQKIEKLWYKDNLVQASVIIIPTTNGQAIFDYCMDKAKQWELGDKDKNNGLLMCVAVQDRKMYILTDTGLETALSDETVKKIIKNNITPYFPQCKYYQGINAGLDEITKTLTAHRSRIGIAPNKYVIAEPLPHKQLKISITAKDKNLYIANCNKVIAPALVEKGSEKVVWGGVSDACKSPDIVIKKGTSYDFVETINDKNSPLDLDKYYQVRILHLNDIPENSTSTLSNAEKTSQVFKLLP